MLGKEQDHDKPRRHTDKSTGKHRSPSMQDKGEKLGGKAYIDDQKRVQLRQRPQMRRKQQRDQRDRMFRRECNRRRGTNHISMRNRPDHKRPGTNAFQFNHIGRVNGNQSYFDNKRVVDTKTK